MSEVKVYKLRSGEEIIAKGGLGPVDKTQDYVLNRVRILIMQPAAQGQMAIVMIPWLASNQDGDVTLRTSALACDPITPHSELEKEYLQQTTGIALAK